MLWPPVRVDVAGGEEPGDGEGGRPRARGEREQQPAHARRGLALAVLVQARGVPRHSGQGGENIRAILQYPGHLHREILIFSQNPLRTVHAYHLVPFKLPKNVQRGPFQELLVLKYFFTVQVARMLWYRPV